MFGDEENVHENVWGVGM